MADDSTISLPARLEAILYLKGRSLSLRELAELANRREQEVGEAMVALMAAYAQRDTALEISVSQGRYSLQLRPGLGELVRDLLPVNLFQAENSQLVLRNLGSKTISAYQLPPWLKEPWPKAQ